MHAMFNFDTIDEFIDALNRRMGDCQSRASKERTQKARAKALAEAYTFQAVINMVEQSNLKTNTIVVSIDEEVKYALLSCDRAVEWISNLKEDLDAIADSIVLQREKIKQQFKTKEEDE